MPAAARIILSNAATADLQELHDYIAEHDSPGNAEHVVDKIAATIESLQRFPDRSAYTKELLSLGIKRYRETYFKPYRIVYTVDPGQVTVHLIVDGRRDMQALLQKRLLRP